MTTLMNRYKALPQMTKNYIQLGALVTALGAFYYRDTIRDKLYPTEQKAMDSVNNAKNKAEKMAHTHDVSQSAK